MGVSNGDENLITDIPSLYRYSSYKVSTPSFYRVDEFQWTTFTRSWIRRVIEVVRYTFGLDGFK